MGEQLKWAQRYIEIYEKSVSGEQIVLGLERILYDLAKSIVADNN
jgi:hypothetical protein